MSDTPRTDALHKAQEGIPYFKMWKHAEDLERELNEAKAELARAMRIVEAAKAWNESICIRTGSELMKLVSEWEAGK